MAIMKLPKAIVVTAAVVLLITAACAKSPAMPLPPSAADAAVVTGVTSFPVLPSTTDPEITQFNQPHWIYVNRDRAPDRHELLLWLTGTDGKGHGAQGFANLAAGLGYRVISLMYPNDIPASACARDRNEDAFEEFRLAIIQGGQASYQNGRRTLVVEKQESIQHRLVKLLQYLQRTRPTEEWGQFLNADGTLKWDSIAVAGQSQGGGHAALIGIKHRVARVLCFGSPKDYNKALDAPAAWYGKKSATPKGLFFAFNHHLDPKGCTPEQLVSNLNALGLNAFGAPAEVDSESYPFHHARVLFTGHPAVSVEGVESEGATAAHGSAINTRNADRWKQVWTYMLTEP